MRRGLAASREQAQAAVAARRVVVSGTLADKPSRLVAAGEPVRLRGEQPRFVGRGGLKLEAALDELGVDVAGRRGLDVGASTGGFTDCLLQRGARDVVAVDVGRGQLHERLRADSRVTVRERCHVRRLSLDDVGGEPFPLVTADLSFISLASVVPNLLHLAAPEADLVLLVKPQFEVGRADAARERGVVRDPELWAAALGRVAAALGAGGAAIMGMMVSPLRGADGNVEFFVHARAPTDARGSKGRPAVTNRPGAGEGDGRERPVPRLGDASEIARVVAEAAGAGGR